MKISVIVPVYNCADYVERCIRSIMAQTYHNLEIICVDDGSSDGSGNILDALALEDSRIRVIHQANCGASAARNTGINNMTGQFVTFVDSDDAIEPDMYEMLMSLFADEDIDIAHCGYRRVYSDGSTKDVTGTGKCVIQTRYEAAECLLRGTLFVGSMWNKLYKAHLFTGVRLDPAVAINEDILANAALFNCARRLVFKDVCKYHVHERTGSVSSVTKEYKKWIDSVHVAEKMLAIYKNTPAEAAAEERFITLQIGLYRWYIMHSAENSKESMRVLSAHIDDAINMRKCISSRQYINYKLMRHFPRLYKLAYKIYDKIRVPDWDVK